MASEGVGIPKTASRLQNQALTSFLVVAAAYVGVGRLRGGEMKNAPRSLNLGASASFCDGQARE